MVIVEACQLALPNPSLSYPFPPPHITSFLFDPNSLSLALHHSDTSLSLYPSFSPLSLSSFPPPSSLIPAPTSSAAFLHLHHPSSPNPFSVFLTTSPFHGGTSVLLRFFMFNPTRKVCSKLRVRSTHRDLKVDDKRFGVVFAVSHGVSLKLEGGSNVFALYSVSNSKIWVFAVKLVTEFEEVKLMKCAVIDCVFPVFSISIKFGHLILGEENGVRVLPLRSLVKGKTKKDGRVNSRRNVNVGVEKSGSKLHNGLIQGPNGTELVVYPNRHRVHNVEAAEGSLTDELYDGVEGKTGKHTESVKLRTMKFRLGSKECGECFLAFNIEEAKNLEPSKKLEKPPKAISIQALSPSKFLVLDSTGVLHLLSFPSSARGSESPYQMKQLTQKMKVCKFSVLPGAQAVWISDGQYTVHEIVLPDEETSNSETDGKEEGRIYRHCNHCF
ncbi:OLC1v1010778C3 [Oldenlandia corymbosa var. corymbosa]|uniref:OLC1v1010778C3 n=1 Tax=Oldenlandia corymbosa var. corymbosa TaxID=529605 RepID=A0AAV1DSA3_OLDCO|nr:OLC1v1010778C3 [Oldenlandia corymbosa var. corymbosa]